MWFQYYSVFVQQVENKLFFKMYYYQQIKREIETWKKGRLYVTNFH